MTPRILIIAGSDSGGGAGIQADIKTVTMLGGHAMTAVTAITAQNTVGVNEVHPVPAAMVLAQIDAVAGDIGVDAVKIGMIGSPDTARAVADRMADMKAPIVFDPVMVASSGSVLADDATIAAFERLMAIARVTTPNLPELAALTAMPVTHAIEIERAALILCRRHRTAILAKGGHGEGDTVHDTLFADDAAPVNWTNPRIATRHTHGTGCTLSSALAAGLAAGMEVEPAVARAIRYVRAALTHAPGLGDGVGPMGHALGGAPFEALSR